jgi:hypothetical protein
VLVRSLVTSRCLTQGWWIKRGGITHGTGEQTHRPVALVTGAATGIAAKKKHALIGMKYVMRVCLVGLPRPVSLFLPMK